MLMECSHLKMPFLGLAYLLASANFQMFSISFCANQPCTNAILIGESTSVGRLLVSSFAKILMNEKGTKFGLPPQKYDPKFETIFYIVCVQ